MDSSEPRWSRESDGIHIDVEFAPEIHIDVDFNMTEQEYADLMDHIEGRRVSRIKQVVHLYYSARKTIREIADIVKVSKSQVHKDIVGFRNEFLSTVKHDLAINKKALGLLVELFVQTDSRIRALQEQYEQLGQCLQVLGTGIRRVSNRLTANPAARISREATLREEAKEIRVLIQEQRAILAQLRNETHELLAICSAFGLTGPEALTFTSGDDNFVQQKIAEVKTFLTKVVLILRDELKDEVRQAQVFNRIAGEITAHGLYGPNKSEQTNDNDFRI